MGVDAPTIQRNVCADLIEIVGKSLGYVYRERTASKLCVRLMRQYV